MRDGPMSNMAKEKYYDRCRFSADVIREALEKIKSIGKKQGTEVETGILHIYHDDSSWRHIDFEEFISDYRKYDHGCHFLASGKGLSIEISYNKFSSSLNTRIKIEAPDRNIINSIFDIFERNSEASKIVIEENRQNDICVFIGHGRSGQWRDLKDHLQDKHKIRVSAYETGARAGHTIRDILDDMADESSFAILVMTGEDEQATGKLRCRQNVVHEAGLFQGKLGFPRAIVLLENGTEKFSNLDGIQYIEFSKNNIKETFGDVLATIKREFGNLDSK